MSEVLIIGGGIAGFSMACALAPLGRDITVVEPRSGLPPLLEQSDARTVALSHQSIALLNEIGAWQHLDADRTCPYQRMLVWEQDIAHALRFGPEHLDAPDLGEIVENNNLMHALSARVGELDNITVLEDKLEYLSLVDERPKVRLASGEVFQPELLIGADGANSLLRERASIGVRRKDYESSAIVARLVPEKGHLDTAWQRFLPTGPIALLPQFDNSFALVWSSTDYRELVDMDDDEFLAALNDAVGVIPPGAIIETGPRRSFPLRLQLANEVVKDNLALIADAAHAVHPLAGQGINLGFADIAVLTKVLAEAEQKHRPLGELTGLQRFARERETANHLMGLSFDMIERLFRADHQAIASLRQMGMGWVARSSALPAMFARAAGA